MEKLVATINVTCFDNIYAGVPRLPKEGEEVFSRDFTATLGGGSVATLVNLFRLGVPVEIGTFLGNDVYSQMALAQYRAAGVEPVNFYRGTGCPVMISTAISTENERTFVSYHDAESVRLSEKKAYDFLKNAAFVYINPDYPDVNQQLKRDGAVLFFDTGISEDYTLEKLKPTLEIADYFTPNLKEAMLLTKADSPQEALSILSEYVKNPVIKLGGQGCLFMEEGEPVIVPEIEEFYCVDATGAGDAFMAGLIYGVYHGYSLHECVLFGNITGGAAVMGMGCLSKYVTQKELLEKFHQYQTVIRR